MSSITPLYDYVIIKPDEVESQTKSKLLYIPDTAKNAPAHGVVIAVGEGKLVSDVIVGLRIKVGDRVMFAKYSGYEIEVDDVKYIATKEMDIIGVLND